MTIGQSSEICWAWYSNI